MLARFEVIPCLEPMLVRVHVLPFMVVRLLGGGVAEFHAGATDLGPHWICGPVAREQQEFTRTAWSSITQL